MSTKHIEIHYRPHIHQKAIHQALREKEIVVCAAGRRFGKTKCALAFAIERSFTADEEGRTRVWYVAPTYRQAKMIAWKELLWMIPNELLQKKPNNTDLIVELIGDREIALKGADDPDGLRGPGLDGLICDEYAKMKPGVWEEVLEPALTDKGGVAFFIGTPKMEGVHFKHLYDWAKDSFNKDAASFLFKTIDNPYMDKARIAKIKKKLESTGRLDLYNQEYEASFECFRGSIYPNFRRKYYPEGHLVRPFNIPWEWTHYIGIDPHDQTPTAVIVGAVSPDNILYIYKDYFFASMTPSQISRKIKENHPMLYRAWGDSACFAKKNMYEVGESVGNIYAENGIVINAVNKNLRDGHSKVREWLNFVDDRPNILFFDNLEYTIDHLQAYSYKDQLDDSEDSKEKPIDVNKHHPDCVRYLVMGSPVYRPGAVKCPVGGDYRFVLSFEDITGGVEKKKYIDNGIPLYN